MKPQKHIIKPIIIIGINFSVSVGLIVLLSILVMNYVIFVELAIIYCVLFAIPILGCIIRIVFSCIDLARAIKEYRQPLA